MPRKYDLVVIGGGVVGLWVALLAGQTGRRVALLERCGKLGTAASARNSGVLHAGLYYAPGSLKALHCVTGRRRTVDFLRAHGVPFALCGKFIVPAATVEPGEQGAPDDAYEQLTRLQKNAEANGVSDVARVSNTDNRYPFLRADWALHVASTGIVDLPRYVAALEQAVRQCGVAVFLNRECSAGEPGRVLVRDRSDPNSEAIDEFTAEAIVNAAGLYADTVAESFGCRGYAVRPNKGSYFRLRFPLPVQTLVYPLPAQHSTFLGVHYTPDVHGAAFAGPNSVWTDSKTDTQPDADRDAFFHGLSRIVTGYTAQDLIPSARVGLRPRLYSQGVACDDFVMTEHPGGVCHLLGIESPGLTAAPSLAQAALERLGVL